MGREPCPQFVSAHWTSPSGEHKTAWQVDYKDSAGHRRSKQFPRKKEAEAWLVNASWEVKQGTHTPEFKIDHVSKLPQKSGSIRLPAKGWSPQPSPHTSSMSDFTSFPCAAVGNFHS